ncbi:MAG: hypothetical protein A2X49_07100 [Lentisphaerae bacterium GWF2_52_8]|nr:MAG: hypothetical protein A2X49_07100 [Lentisphaerae bacterium GWF2_52_8]
MLQRAACVGKRYTKAEDWNSKRAWNDPCAIPLGRMEFVNQKPHGDKVLCDAKREAQRKEQELACYLRYYQL